MQTTAQSDWIDTILGDVIEIYDYKRVPLNSRERSKRQGPYPYYGASGIFDYIDDYIFDGRYLLVAEDGENLNSRKTPVAFFASGKFWVNNHAHIIRGIPGIADDYFLMAYIENLDILGYITGAAQPKLSQANLKSIKLRLPPYPTQRKIADILSAYDDLIENNTRRIRILEQIAQAVYREWFVHFRFPGHEGVRVVDGLPEGWNVTNLDHVLSELESGSRPKGGIDPEERGVPSVGAENIIDLGQYNYSSEKYVSSKFFKAMTRGHIKSKDVLLYKDGAYIGRKSMFRDGFPHDECCVNEHVFILRTNEKCTQNFLYFWLDQPEMTQNIRNLNANAAQPGINQTGVRGLPILLSDSKTIKMFDDVVDPMLALLFNLSKKNANLRRTRDLLLPRLVGGEINLDAVFNEMDGEQTP